MVHTHIHALSTLDGDTILRASDLKNLINVGKLLAINTTPETSEPPASLLPFQA